MSQTDQPKKAGATFTWVLGAFAGFAVLFIVIQAFTRSKEGFDPRAQERSDNTAEILKAQAENIAKLGLNDAAKKQNVVNKTLAMLAAKKPGVSAEVVPGSPTQLKQAAASVPVAAPAAAAKPAAPGSTPPAIPAVPAPTVPPAIPAVPAPAVPPMVPSAIPAVPAPAVPPMVPPAIPAVPAPAVPPPLPPAIPAVPAPAVPTAPAPAPVAPALPK